MNDMAHLAHNALATNATHGRVASASPTYTIRLKGEQHSFPIDCWTSITLDQAATVLSDVTGYRADSITRWITEGMDGNPPKVITISHAEAGRGSGVDRGSSPSPRSTPAFMVQQD